MGLLIGPEIITLSVIGPAIAPLSYWLFLDQNKREKISFSILSLKCPYFSLVQKNKYKQEINLEWKMVPSPAALPNPNLSSHGGLPGTSARITYFIVFPTAIWDGSS